MPQILEVKKNELYRIISEEFQYYHDFVDVSKY